LLAMEGSAAGQEQALELLGVVIDHPATWQGVRLRAERLQAKVEAALTEDEVTAAELRAQENGVDGVVAELLQSHDG
jgi:hypothetical protein